MHATDFVESYFDAWNHCDPQAVADHLAADGVYCDIPENVQRTHDELIVSLNQFFSRYRHRYEQVGDILTNGNTIAFQYKMIAGGRKRNNGIPDSWTGAEFVTLNGDAAMTITDYYDAPTSSTMPAGESVREQKYAKSGLSDEQLLSYKARLEHIMSSQQAFLRSDLTLPKLAETVGCSVNHLSQVINSGFNMSFFDYLNRYRIEHARELLSGYDSQHGAILNIAFMVGFNSNSAFYAAFKKCVGQTPAQYRRARSKSA